jgi:hypothetical protein
MKSQTTKRLSSPKPALHEALELARATLFVAAQKIAKPREHVEVYAGTNGVSSMVEICFTRPDGKVKRSIASAGPLPGVLDEIRQLLASLEPDAKQKSGRRER